MKASQWYQVGLALEDPDDGLSLDRRKGGCLSGRLGSLNDLDPIVKGGMGSEGNHIVRKGKGKRLLRDFS